MEGNRTGGKEIYYKLRAIQIRVMETNRSSSSLSGKKEMDWKVYMELEFIELGHKSNV